MWGQFYISTISATDCYGTFVAKLENSDQTQIENLQGCSIPGSVKNRLYEMTPKTVPGGRDGPSYTPLVH